MVVVVVVVEVERIRRGGGAWCFDGERLVT